MNRVKAGRKKAEGGARSLIPCIVFLISAACVILVISYTGATIASKKSSAQPGGKNPRGGGESADVMEEGGSEGEEGGEMVFGKVVGAAPFLPDFDLSRPVEHGPKGRRLSKEEQEYVSAEAEYQMRLARRNELTGGKRPEPPFPRWKPGKIKEVFLTPTYPCKRAERLGGTGTDGEGGKWVCNIRKLRAGGRRPIVYSIGSAGETSFEQAVRARLGTKAFTFDPFLDDQQAAAIRAKHILRYIPIGLGAGKQLSALRRGAPGKRFATLAQLMGKLNHSHVDVLKIDCERCEERLMEDLLNAFGKENPPADQILVEIHQIRHVARTTQVLFPLEDMGYRLFNAEANPRCSSCYELSFVHESFLKPKSMFPDAAAAGGDAGGAGDAAGDPAADTAEAAADAAADAVAAAAADSAAEDAAGDGGSGEGTGDGSQ
ncbi:hypothetical protein CLOP_g4209 [Closterium sp. NIES-67]|nr:hypothetical protein CLOP_g4209 [Closterium sp. NIES-67]